MKSFHKDYTIAELKLVIRAWNKHFRIYLTGKSKKQLADELDKYLHHDKDGEIQFKEEVDAPELPDIKGAREKAHKAKMAEVNHPDVVNKIRMEYERKEKEKKDKKKEKKEKKEKDKKKQKK